MSFFEAGRKARAAAESETSNPQERNRLWWEKMPMTYADWEGSERKLETEEHFRRYLEEFRTCSSFIVNFPFDEFAGKRVLEIGCGFGAASCLFANAGARIHAVDLTAAAVEGTKAISAFFGYDVQVEQMDAEKLQFPNETFDYVFSWGVLHHSHDSQAAFGQVSRVLKPNGQGMIMVYNRYSFRYVRNTIHGLLLKGMIFKGETPKSVQRFYTDGYYQRHFGARELRRCLQKEGLYVSRITITHMKERMFHKWPKALDDYLKDKIGWLLVAEFTKRS